MKPHYLRSENGHRDRWMVSYLDVLTILLIFFVAIAAHSMEQAKAEAVASSKSTVMAASSTASTATTGEVTPSNPATMSSDPKSPDAKSPDVSETSAAPAAEPDAHPQLSDARKKLEQQKLDVHVEPRGLVISLSQAVLFSSGDDHISKSALPMIGEIAAVLQEIPNQVSLVGHADAVPIHNRRFKNNWELSAARSLQLLELLTGRYGIAESRLSVASFGSNEPKTSNDTPDGRANNRRVEIVILDAIPTTNSTIANAVE